MAEIKIKDVRTGEVHLLKSFTKTQCGINIKKDEANWIIVGSEVPITCGKKHCSCRRKGLRFKRQIYDYNFAPSPSEISKLYG